MRIVGPKEIRAAVMSAIKASDLHRWTRHPAHLALHVLGDAPLLSPLANLVNKPCAETWHDHHKAALRTGVIGGYKSQVERHRTGLAPSPLCKFYMAANGTAHHIYYYCKHEKLAAIRKQLTDGQHPDKAASFFQMAYLAEDWKPQWAQALRADPSLTWAPRAYDEHIFWNGDIDLQGMFQGFGATDGAALNNHLEPIRQCGWAAALCDANGAMLAVTYGTLPFPFPTILLAELWGFLQFIRQSMAGGIIGVDNKHHSAYCTAADRCYPHIWHMIFHELSDRSIDIRLGPPSELVCIPHKVKSHRSDVEIAARTDPVDKAMHLANKVADRYARLGAEARHRSFSAWRHSSLTSVSLWQTRD